MFFADYGGHSVPVELFLSLVVAALVTMEPRLPVDEIADHSLAGHHPDTHLEVRSLGDPAAAACDQQRLRALIVHNLVHNLVTARDKRPHELEIIFDKRKYRLAADNAQDYGQWLAVLSARYPVV